MVEALYMKDSLVKEFPAQVASVNGKFIVLDRTSFFPKGGGVDNDTGDITRLSDNMCFKVVFVGKFEGVISHEVDKEGLSPGDKVHCKLDWDRRYKLMRYHTAAHVISGIFSREYGLLITGNQLTIEKGRIDFNMDNMDLDLLKKGIARANELISQDLPVKIYTLKREEAEKRQDLFKLAIGFPHDLPEIRVVEIVGFDSQADGGCHVQSLKEIGTINFLEAQNKGKNNRRMYFNVL
ncbi:MAG: alanyl-tRNA editing protein [Nanoarchaeota archaeon]|nr:alanyl-tRNA editing protein [Nanoarchaeota archaeon]